MKKIFCLCLMLLLLSGCQNKEEEAKNEYIAYKNNLLSRTDYEEDIPLDIVVDIKRKDTESVSYKVILSNSKENMHNIKAMVVNNYNNEDVFPSVGLFNEKEELLVENTDKEITLKGNIETTKNISKLKLNLKLWIEYDDDNGETKEIYYQL